MLTEPTVIKGRLILPRYEIGDRVTYTSKAGTTEEYVVLAKWTEDIMYGVYRGSKSVMLRLGRHATDKGFTVSAMKVKRAS